MPIWTESTTYRVEWKAADGKWCAYSTGWTRDEAMRVVWLSGLTDKIQFRIVQDRRAA